MLTLQPWTAADQKSWQGNDLYETGWFILREHQGQWVLSHDWKVALN